MHHGGLMSVCTVIKPQHHPSTLINPITITPRCKPHPFKLKDRAQSRHRLEAVSSSLDTHRQRLSKHQPAVVQSQQHWFRFQPGTIVVSCLCHLTNDALSFDMQATAW